MENLILGNNLKVQGSFVQNKRTSLFQTNFFPTFIKFYLNIVFKYIFEKGLYQVKVNDILKPDLDLRNITFFSKA